MMIPFVQMARQCAPMVAPKTLAAIVNVESGGYPLVLYDNVTGKRIFPSSVQDARHILKTLVAEGHKVDVGLGQIDTENFSKYGLNFHNVFNTCNNLHVAGEILHSAYKQAAYVYHKKSMAMFHSFEVYNSGMLTGDRTYATKVKAAFGEPVYIRAVAGGLRYVAYTRPVHNLMAAVAAKTIRVSLWVDKNAKAWSCVKKLPAHALGVTAWMDYSVVCV